MGESSGRVAQTVLKVRLACSSIAVTTARKHKLRELGMGMFLCSMMGQSIRKRSVQRCFFSPPFPPSPIPLSEGQDPSVETL